VREQLILVPKHNTWVLLCTEYCVQPKETNAPLELAVNGVSASMPSNTRASPACTLASVIEPT